jgi:hypothetical protein
MKKMIYFPLGYEAKDKVAVLLWVEKELPDDYQGNINLEALESGRFGIYSKRRTIPYSDQASYLCEAHKKKRAALDEEYKNLIKAMLKH